MTAERCGATTDLPSNLFTHRYVFVCDREAGHGGTVHSGQMTRTGPGDGHMEHQWPMHWRERPDRYAHLDEATGPYRVGRKCPWNVYRQIGDDPSDTDVALFDAHRPNLAALVVNALNAWEDRT